MHRPNIFIAGKSGSGKSASIRGLDPKTTIIINVERKTLPFRHAGQFKKQAMINSYDGFLPALNRAIQSDCKVIVIDSFTALCDQVHVKFVEFADRTGDGSFVAWSAYKSAITAIIEQCKISDKYIIFTGITDSIQDESLRCISTIAVQGSLKSKIESFFEIVLFLHVAVEGNGSLHQFQTNNRGENTAKSPMGLFESLYIDNDLNLVIDKINQYYSE